VRSRQPSLRNAYRRASPNSQNPFEPCAFRNPEPLRGEVIPNAAHRFAFANLELSQQRDVRASLGLDNRVSHEFLSRDFHDRQLPRCVLPTNATHYLTNCTRARGFLGSLRKNLSISSEPKRSMRFTTPSIASAGDSVFASEKYSFPKPDVPSLLLFRHPPLRRDSIFSNGYRSCCLVFQPNERQSGPGSFEWGAPAERRVEIGLFNAPVKETRTPQSEIRFPKCDARALEPFSRVRFCRRSLEKTCAISLAAVFKCKTLAGCFEVATPS